MSITGKEFDVIYQPVETDAELTQKKLMMLTPKNMVTVLTFHPC